MTEGIEKLETPAEVEPVPEVEKAEATQATMERERLVNAQKELVFEAYSLRRQLEEMPKRLAQIERELDKVTAQLGKSAR